MKFNDKEMSLLIARRVDRVVFQSKGQNIFIVDLEKLMKDKIENDETLKKQLLAQVLQSED